MLQGGQGFRRHDHAIAVGVDHPFDQLAKRGRPHGSDAVHQRPAQRAGVEPNALLLGVGKGYWVVADDGSTWAFGDARWLGSVNSLGLPRVAPIVGFAVAA